MSNTDGINWTVDLEVSGDGPPLNDDQIGWLLDELVEYDGALAIDTERLAFSVTISVMDTSVTDRADAISYGIDAMHVIADRIGLPPIRIDSASAMTWEEHDLQLEEGQ
jgi:hypothetical protein